MRAGTLLLHPSTGQSLFHRAYLDDLPAGLLIFVFLTIGLLLSGCSGSSGSTISIDENGHWQGSLQIGSTPPNIQADLQALNSEKDIRTSLSYRAGDAQLDPVLTLEGNGGIGQVRELLYGELAEQIQPLGAATQLNLEGRVDPGESLNITLESNPSTGYLWQIAPSAATLIRADSQFQLEQKDHNLGGTAHQTFHVVGTGAGIAHLSLEYRRSWENKPIEHSLTLVASSFSQLSDLSDPRPAVEDLGFPATQASSVVDTDSAQSLPPIFDWRKEGKTTTIKDQGACGSCWAFASVGVLESAILIKDGTSQDLSEQYLLSCNLQGWGCGGGWTAHDYHEDLRPPSQLVAGAVLEQSFPYQATNAACKSTYSHPYQITDWHYVGANTAHPTDNEIKQAIYSHGPVQTTVCTGSAFTQYRSGTFSKDESDTCASSGAYVNHAVILVGWDDTRGPNGAWILRNSWGPGWGDKGYMYIDRTVSNIGYFTSYIDYVAHQKLFLPGIWK